MTNEDVFNNGKITGTFNYINPYDPDNTYVGLLISLDNNIYEIIVNQHRMLIDPTGDAVLIRTEDSNPVSITQTFNYSESFDNKIDNLDQNIDFSKIQEELGFDIKDYDSKKTIPTLNPNFIDFNSPW